MTGKITINAERCKGCGLCIGVCRQQCIVVSETANSKGYFPSRFVGAGCTGCGMCGLVCPDVAIEVKRLVTEAQASPEGMPDGSVTIREK